MTDALTRFSTGPVVRFVARKPGRAVVPEKSFSTGPANSHGPCFRRCGLSKHSARAVVTRSDNNRFHNGLALFASRLLASGAVLRLRPVEYSTETGYADGPHVQYDSIRAVRTGTTSSFAYRWCDILLDG